MSHKQFIATPSKTKEILEKYNFSFQKSLGQNFIIDVNILKNMIQYAGISNTSRVIEIGPGIGALTEQLALHAKKVVAIEIDHRLINILKETLCDYENIRFIHQDVLKMDLKTEMKQTFTKEQDIHIVANLPYYITTPILMKLLTDRLPIHHLTLMMQKEVADRIIAQPNSKEYGSLSIVVQYYTEPKIVMTVPKNVFMPKPKVQSAVLKMKVRKEPPVQVIDEDTFFTIVRASFAHRRKTLRNNLIHFFKNHISPQTIDQVLKHVNIDGLRRGETLTIEEFAKIANQFVKV